ncbi:MAG: S8 family serine peptidase [Chloroflexi bacterium]|nr:S8 family serine peptidase [Chloroflexota bacterium]MCI0855230.1 S8 family serine peptidase [Chloroflexota bacterium]MCI0889229.1 S8 family serine peptidase [Chloroflexota bacterium]
MRSPLRIILASCAGVSLALLFSFGWHDERTAAVQLVPFVQSEVQASIALQTATDVLVTLREPTSIAGLSPASPSAKWVIALQQNSVLAGFAEDEFITTRRYKSLPILAGRINAAGLAKLTAHADVTSVAVDGVGSIATGETLPIIHAPEVHDNGFTGEGVVVAVLDTGADIDHPDLEDDILYEMCFASDCDESEHPADDEHGHGTNVTGIITSDGTIAPLGVAPDAKIAVYRVLRRSGSGRFSDWIAALDDIIANHPEVSIVNMSLQSRSGCPSSALTLAISTLRNEGVATFIASGNHGNKNLLLVPSCIAEAISVGATYDGDNGSVDGWKADCSDPTTALDQVTCWSDSDNSLDLLAPGARATSTGVGGGTITYMGTSQASPHAAGVAALLFQAFPDLTVNELEARMKATGKLLTDDLDDADPSTNRTTPRVDARVALLDPDEDADGDGCSNGEEFGSDPRFGGQRNPLNPWDFHDVNGDGIITLFDDILAVINGFGTGGNDPLLDRSPAPAAGQPWQQGPPDGTIDVANDILGIASQFGHRCVGAP